MSRVVIFGRGGVVSYHRQDFRFLGDRTSENVSIDGGFGSVLTIFFDLRSPCFSERRPVSHLVPPPPPPRPSHT